MGILLEENDMTSLYSGLSEQEFRSAVDMQNRLTYYRQGGKPMMQAICINTDCGIIYEGRKIDHAVRCSEELICPKCGGLLLPENELPEVEIVEVL
jgi:hypothetical protein